jgi:hypothetical protein
MVTHAYNLSCLEAEIEGSRFETSLCHPAKLVVSETVSQRTSQATWFISIIPVILRSGGRRNVGLRSALGKSETLPEK